MSVTYSRALHNPKLSHKAPPKPPERSTSDLPIPVESQLQGQGNDAPLISLEDWKAFLDKIPDDIWTSKFSSTRHINADKGIFPMIGLDKTETLKSATVKQFKSKMYALSEWELTKLFSLGNPTIPEAQGGLTFENICRHVHSSGRTDVKSKPFPPKFFLHPDSGNNYSVALRRIYFYVNLA
tara:strand:- start:853 stop:1398 length:546 start_codon:yes stop_codon:yes gene_type:complete